MGAAEARERLPAHGQPAGDLINRVAVVDLETTGLDPKVDRVVEVAILVPGQVLFESLVRPDDLDFPAGVHGLTSGRVRRSPSLPELIPDLMRLLAGRVVIAHNARFDLAFIHAEFGRARVALPRTPFLCTVDVAEALELDHASRSLAYACERHGIPLQNPHTAAGDASAVAALVNVYRGEAHRRGFDLGNEVRWSSGE